jgi:hypothetical protein
MIRINKDGYINRINRMDLHNMTQMKFKANDRKVLENLITSALNELVRFGNPTIKGITLYPTQSCQLFLWTTPFSGFRLSPVDLANPNLENENNKQFCVSIIDINHDEENPSIVPKSLRTQW